MILHMVCVAAEESLVIALLAKTEKTSRLTELAMKPDGWMNEWMDEWTAVSSIDSSCCLGS